MGTIATTQDDISRWVDEGGAGPDLDGVPPADETKRGSTWAWIAGGAALVCAALVAFYALRRA